MIQCAKAIGVSKSLILEGTIFTLSKYQIDLYSIKHGNCIVVKDILLYSTLCLGSFQVLE